MVEGAYAASKRRVSIPPLCHVEIVDAVPADGLAAGGESLR